ncbi:hypothetical protein GCK72_004156 [Caenorhabditis remanei]|uniref:Uncharacterized protein n=1 Tax=Caenorhabditis remanei TaxID=31234 RepID=A0A6A5HAW2_CAERE|nr:hypothetical protein GCK72_004156 [Caenorhabditis remanei]KAF1764209.1 hypothetical protein GCK72_004156 [Caenorhabditis remanei]
MNSNRPLSYDSFKKVLIYMNANLRLRLATQCPSIRSAEKAAPLKIKFFQPIRNCMFIDDTIYHFGVYKKYPEGECPSRVLVANNTDGSSRDVDEFGFDYWGDANAVTEGDVDVRNPEEQEEEYPEKPDGFVEQEENKLKDLQARLADSGMVSKSRLSVSLC